MPAAFDFIFWAAFLLIGGSFAWRYFKAGSFTGAMLGGTVRETLGELTLASGSASSQVLKVHILTAKGSDEPFIGLAIVSKAPLGASMVPIKLSRSQATELSGLLQQASARVVV